MKLQGKIAIVTGASRGIGKAVAQTLAREGAAVGVNYIKSAAEANRVVAEIREGDGNARPIMADVSLRSHA